MLLAKTVCHRTFWPSVAKPSSPRSLPNLQLSISMERCPSHVADDHTTLRCNGENPNACCPQTGDGGRQNPPRDPWQVERASVGSGLIHRCLDSSKLAGGALSSGKSYLEAGSPAPRRERTDQLKNAGAGLVRSTSSRSTKRSRLIPECLIPECLIPECLIPECLIWPV